MELYLAFNNAYVSSQQEGPSVSVVGDTYRTNCAYALIDMLIPPEGGPGPHSHVTFQEGFYIIKGEIQVITKGKTYYSSAFKYALKKMKTKKVIVYRGTVVVVL